MLLSLSRSTAVVQIGERTATVEGEAFIRGHGSPDFLAYRNSRVKWDDGAELSADEKDRILADLVQSAKDRGMTVEVE